MSVFPTAKHLCSWAGCCPRNDQSGGKIKSTRISKAGASLKPLLVQVANALVKSNKHPEFKERYRRIKARRGHMKAIIAICRMLLTAIWNILTKLTPYTSKGFLSDSIPAPQKLITNRRRAESLALKGVPLQGRDSRAGLLLASPLFFRCHSVACFAVPISPCLRPC